MSIQFFALLVILLHWYWWDYSRVVKFFYQNILFANSWMVEVHIHISSDEENGCQQMAYYELSYQDITIFIFVLHTVEIQKG